MTKCVNIELVGLIPRLARKPMKFLAFALALCGLVLSGSAGADQTCKAKANQRKLAGQALVNFDSNANLKC